MMLPHLHGLLDVAHEVGLLVGEARGVALGPGPDGLEEARGGVLLAVLGGLAGRGGAPHPLGGRKGIVSRTAPLTGDH